eukprot:31135-Pelagococcus_subviridis.AAC.10
MGRTTGNRRTSRRARRGNDEKRKARARRRLGKYTCCYCVVIKTSLKGDSRPCTKPTANKQFTLCACRPNSLPANRSPCPRPRREVLHHIAVRYCDGENLFPPPAPGLPLSSPPTPPCARVARPPRFSSSAASRAITASACMYSPALDSSS